jgi:hypothetical protein
LFLGPLVSLLLATWSQVEAGSEEQTARLAHCQRQQEPHRANKQQQDTWSDSSLKALTLEEAENRSVVVA